MSKSTSAASCGLVFTLAAAACVAQPAGPRAGSCVDSPRAVLTMCVAADAHGPYYEVYRGERMLIAHARLGLVLDGFGNAPVHLVVRPVRIGRDAHRELRARRVHAAAGARRGRLRGAHRRHEGEHEAAAGGRSRLRHGRFLV